MAFATSNDLEELNCQNQDQLDKNSCINHDEEKKLILTICRPFSIVIHRLTKAEIELWKNHKKHVDKPKRKSKLWSRGIVRKKKKKGTEVKQQPDLISSKIVEFCVQTNEQEEETQVIQNEAENPKENESQNDEDNVLDQDDTIEDFPEWKFKRKRIRIFDSDSDEGLSEVNSNENDDNKGFKFVLERLHPKSRRLSIESTSNCPENLPKKITEVSLIENENEITEAEEESRILDAMTFEVGSDDIRDENENVELDIATRPTIIDVQEKLENINETENNIDNSELICEDHVEPEKSKNITKARVILTKLDDMMDCLDKGYTLSDIERISIEHQKSLKLFRTQNVVTEDENEMKYAIGTEEEEEEEEKNEKEEKIDEEREEHHCLLENEMEDDSDEGTELVLQLQTDSPDPSDDEDEINPSNDSDYQPSLSSISDDSRNIPLRKKSIQNELTDDSSTQMSSIGEKISGENSQMIVEPSTKSPEKNGKIASDIIPEDISINDPKCDKTIDTEESSSSNVCTTSKKSSKNRTSEKNKTFAPRLKKIRRGLFPKSHSTTCDVCSKNFETREILSEHLFKHTPQELRDAYVAKSKIPIDVVSSDHSSSGGDVQNSSDTTNNQNNIPIISKEIQVQNYENQNVRKIFGKSSSSSSTTTTTIQELSVCACHNDDRTEKTSVQIEMVLFCETCRVLFRRSECFETHYRVYPMCNSDRLKGRSPRLFCSTCRVIVGSLTDMRRHLEEHANENCHGTVSFVCNICRIVFFGVGTVFCTHWFQHDKDVGFVASKHSFPKMCVSERGKNPVGAAPGEKYLFVAEFVCRFCKLQCLTEVELSTHIKKGCKAQEMMKNIATKTLAKPPLPPPPPNNNKDTNNTTTTTTTNKTEKKSRVVKLKTMPLVSPKSAYTKMDMIKVWICDFCDEKFPSREAFEEHSTEHLQTKGYPGYLCVFHTDLKAAYICNICRAVFKTMSELTRHWYSHNLIKFKCTICFGSFTSLSVFTRHVANRCHILGAGCRVIYGMSNHVCDICKSMYETSEELKKHCTTSHAKSTKKTVVEAETTTTTTTTTTTQQSLSIEKSNLETTDAAGSSQNSVSTVAVADSSQSPSSTVENVPVIVSIKSLDSKNTNSKSPQPTSYVINITIPSQPANTTAVEEQSAVLDNNIKEIDPPLIEKSLEDPLVQVVLSNASSTKNSNSSIADSLPVNIEQLNTQASNDKKQNDDHQKSQNSTTTTLLTDEIIQIPNIQTDIITNKVGMIVENQNEKEIEKQKNINEVIISSSESEGDKNSGKSITKEVEKNGENILSDSDESDIQIIEVKNILEDILKVPADGNKSISNQENTVEEESRSSVIKSPKIFKKSPIKSPLKTREISIDGIIIEEKNSAVEENSNQQQPPEPQGKFLRVKNLSELMATDNSLPSVNCPSSSINNGQTLTDVLSSQAQSVMKSPKKSENPQQINSPISHFSKRILLPNILPKNMENRRANPLTPRSDSNTQLPNPMYRLNQTSLTHQNGSHMMKNPSPSSSLSSSSSLPLIDASAFSVQTQQALNMILNNASSSQYQQHTQTISCSHCIPPISFNTQDDFLKHMSVHYQNQTVTNQQIINRGRLPPSYETHLALSGQNTRPMINEQQNDNNGSSSRSTTAAIFYNCKICRQYRTLVKSEVVEHVTLCWQRSKRMEYTNSLQQSQGFNQQQNVVMQQAQVIQQSQEYVNQLNQLRQLQSIQQQQQLSSSTQGNNNNNNNNIPQCPQQIYNCPGCLNFQYTRTEDLEQHIRDYHSGTSNNQLKCNFCPSQIFFASDELLRAHQAIHHPHACGICPQLFGTANELQHHRNIHRHFRTNNNPSIVS